MMDAVISNKKAGSLAPEASNLSASERAARVLKSLKSEEWRTLAGLERASLSFGAGDAGLVSRMSRLPLDRVTFALDQLNKKGLVVGRGQSYAPTVEAVETLALNDYVKKDILSALGAIIAKGKESDVYEAFDEEGSLYALKFFKLGRVSFTRVRKKRFLDRTETKSWMTVNYEAAKREYSALKKLEGISPWFPRAVAHNRSTVLLRELSGVRLSQRPELVDPATLLLEVLKAARAAFTEAHLVNADLSEYNLLTDGGSVWLIDWPQAVSSTHPNAEELLRHDVASVVRFFGRAYGLKVDEKVAFDFVSGRRASLE